MAAGETRVLIIGGGLAGLAAAVALAERRVPALVLESRPRLGGRASSFLDSTTDAYVDNCQHVAMGCCTNFFHLMRTVGLAADFRREPVLYFIGPSGQPDRFAASNLPCPLHLAGAFGGLSYLTWSDKLAIANGLRALAKADDPQLEQKSFAAWLADQRQPPNAIDGFWHVVLVSALSETLDRIAVPQGRKVFVDGFLRHRDGWQVSIPTVPLEELYGSQLIAWLAERGVEIRLQAGVEELQMDDGSVVSVRLRDGSQIAAEEFVLAVPWQRVADLVPGELAAHPTVQNLAQLEAAPITSIHLWFDRPITDLPHAVLINRLSQWMFNRTALSQSPPSATAGHYYQIVISASRDLAGRSQDDIRAAVVDELAAIWPATRDAKLLHQRLVTEHRAVFSVRPGSDALRPAQQSPVANLQFAGDWTQTGWPATMEGAVRSGYLAVENVLRRHGQTPSVLQPDLPTSRLSRWLYGLRDSAGRRGAAADVSGSVQE